MLKQVIKNTESRLIGSNTYEKRISSSYGLLRDNTYTEHGIGGFSADTIEKLVKICDSKSARKETEFVLVALANCSGTSCKF